MIIQEKEGVRLTQEVPNLWHVWVEGPHGWIVQGEWPSICAAYRDFKTTETKITT